MAGAPKANHRAKFTPRSLKLNKKAVILYCQCFDDQSFLACSVKLLLSYLAKPLSTMFGPVPVSVAVPPMLAE